MATEALTKDIPLDAPTDALALTQPHAISTPLPLFSGEQMANALTAYRELQKALDRSMPDQIMDLDGKAFRKKGYWRAIRTAFGLTVEPIAESRESHGAFADGRENFGYIVTYRATNAAGQSATGDGSCFAVEKARRFKCPHPERPGSTRMQHWPHETCPDFDPEYSWRSLPAQATEHNIRSHAHTRAFNRAVSNLVGFGEVSAEEVERDDVAPAAATVQQASPSQTSAPSVAPSAAFRGVHVTEVVTKRGETRGKRWALSIVKFSDGRSGASFDEDLVAFAERCRASRIPVTPVLRPGQRPNTFELVDLSDRETDDRESQHAIVDDGIPF